jgi:hypothetical protein
MTELHFCMTSTIALRLQVGRKRNAALRDEIFTALLVVLRFDPPNRRELGEAELLRRAEEMFDAFYSKYHATAEKFVEYCRKQWRPLLGRHLPRLHLFGHLQAPYRCPTLGILQRQSGPF